MAFYETRTYTTRYGAVRTIDPTAKQTFGGHAGFAGLAHPTELRFL